MCIDLERGVIALEAQAPGVGSRMVLKRHWVWLKRYAVPDWLILAANMNAGGERVSSIDPDIRREITRKLLRKRPRKVESGW